MTIHFNSALAPSQWGRRKLMRVVIGKTLISVAVHSNASSAITKEMIQDLYNRFSHFLHTKARITSHLKLIMILEAKESMGSRIRCLWDPVSWINGIQNLGSMGSRIRYLWDPVPWINGIQHLGSIGSRIRCLWDPLPWINGIQHLGFMGNSSDTHQSARAIKAGPPTIFVDMYSYAVRQLHYMA